MASANKPESAGRQPIPAAKRRRLQQCFEHGSKNSSQGNFDYATDMFTQCVLGDPGNLIYVQQFLRNLYQKYSNNKKGSKFASITGVGIKGSIKKASMSKDWAGVIKSGLEMLKLNPWDISTLTAMASACEALDFGECQLAYLRSALDANPKDVEVNRACGRALARMGQFDQAIACWHRVEQLKPGDEEAQKAVADLAVEKTISHGGYEDAQNSTDVMADRAAKAERQSGVVPLTPEQQLQKAIIKQPDELSNYVELADLHTRNERFAEAEEVLAKALTVSGGEISIRERLEDTQLRRARQQLVIAEKRAGDEKSAEAVELAKQMKAELNRLETEVFRSRSERYPANLGLKYELALRLKRSGQIKEAIQYFQGALGDGKRKGIVHLELGECFQHLKHYKLALSNYESAIEALSDVEQRKLALYRSGVLAMGLKDLNVAEKWLTQLAALDFGYRDVAERLDKISQIRTAGQNQSDA